MVVVLPAPLGPSRPKTSPAWASKLTSLDRVDQAAAQVAERLGQVLDVDSSEADLGVGRRIT